MIGISKAPARSGQHGTCQRAVFLLSSPRSGSTLLRVMLAGHPSLFCPPELNLLPYLTMREREQALGSCQAAQCIDQGCDARDGLLRALMELHTATADEARDMVARWVERDMSTAEAYSELQRLASPRMLLDKSPMNAATIDTLKRAEQMFEAPLYIHLVRHPYAVIESLLRQRTDIAAAPEPERLAEKFWLVTNSNILEFLRQVGSERRHLIRYEELVSNPSCTMKALCTFLGLKFDEAVLTPYQGDRMTTGLRPHTSALGDPNFLKRSKIEPRMGEVWKQVKLHHQPAQATMHLALELQYEVSA